MRELMIASMLALNTSAAFAQSDNSSSFDAYAAHMNPYSEAGPLYFVFGQGGVTCADTLSTIAREGEGQQWVWGYWSGLNLTNPGIGVGAGQSRVWVEVRTLCIANPSILLADATLRAFKYFEANNLKVFDRLPDLATSPAAGEKPK